MNKKQFVNENIQVNEGPCWDGYKQVGMKMKSGREVPNCVPESVEINEKNEPNNPALWSRAKAAAKAKYDVYPSAYANAFASKWYKEKGGTWKTKSESVSERFDKTHLGMLKQAYNDIDRINPNSPTYNRLVAMLDKLSNNELKQIVDADIKFLSLLAKNHLTKKENVTYNVKEGNAFTGALYQARQEGKTEFEFNGKTYPVKEVTNESLTEASMSDIDIIAQEASDFKDFVKEFYKEYKDFPKSKDTIKWLKSIYDNRSTDESIVSESSVEVGDIVFFPSANSAGRVVDRFGRSVTLKLANGKKVKTMVDKVKLLAQDNVNESNTASNIIKDLDKVKNDLIKKVDILIAKKKKLYSTVDIESPMSADEKKLNKDISDIFSEIQQLIQQKRKVKNESVNESDVLSYKKVIKEEYHKVKSFMENKYGFTPELGKVYGNPYVNSFKSEASESDAEMAVDQLHNSIDHAQRLIDKLKSRSNLEPWIQSLITKADDYLNTVNNADGGNETIQEYDLENYNDIKEFVTFLKNGKSPLNEAEYQGRKVKLGKIMQGDVKKFKVFVRNEKGNVVKVNFGQGGDAKGGTMRIRKNNPEARKSFRARHNCDTPGPRWKARYWSCRKW